MSFDKNNQAYGVFLLNSNAMGVYYIFYEIFRLSEKRGCLLQQ